MSNIKISQLPSAGALSGSEILPIVQAGDTKSTSINSIIGQVGLQQVLDNNNTANQSIEIINGTDSVSVGYLGVVASNDVNETKLFPEYIGFNDNSISMASTLKATNVTANRNWEFPDASGTLALLSDIPSSSGWGLTGNAGTTPGTNFIGTIDDKDFVVKVNNQEKLRIDAAYGEVVTDGSFRAIGGLTTVMASSNSGNGYALLSQDSVSKGYLELSNGSGGDGTVYCQNLTDFRTYQLPDASGTLALEKYKVYSAILNLSTNTATILQNTLGATITWTQPFTGQVWATASSQVFTANKTFICQTLINNGGQPYFVIGETGGFDPLSTIVYNVFLYNGTQPGSPNKKVNIEIRVYP